MSSDETLKPELAKAVAECERLREENARSLKRAEIDSKAPAEPKRQATRC